MMILIALAAAAAAQPAPAPAGEMQRIEISYADLNLTNREGAATLYRRVRGAAKAQGPPETSARGLGGAGGLFPRPALAITARLGLYLGGLA